MKYILIIIAIATLLPGCGQAPDNSSVPTKDTQGGTNTPANTSKSAPAASSPSIMTYSSLLATKADMPVCDDAHANQLVYIQSEANFYACSNSLWSVVNIKGSKGDQGAQGAQGQQGIAGTNGKDGQTVNSNMWYDAITKKYWIIPMTAKQSSAANLNSSCGTDYRLPTTVELSDAKSRGLSVAADSVSAVKEAWFSDTQNSLYPVFAMRTGADNYAATAGYYCIVK